MEIPMKCLTSPNNREQGLSVIEFDKKSDSIFLVLVKLFKTQNELPGTQDTNTLLFINVLFFFVQNLNNTNGFSQSKSILMLTSHFVTYLPTFPTDFS